MGMREELIVVINHKTTKFESNSQLNDTAKILRMVVINHKTTKFESNSQLGVHHSRSNMGCYQSQNYEI